MKYLNLTKGFNPYNAGENELIKFESFFFSGGEPHIKLDTDSFNNMIQNVQVTIRLKSMNDFGMLVIATEALRQSGKLGNSYLFAPYMLGARQDRRMIEGEPLSSKVFANWINEMSYDQVEIFDPHSGVISALIDNCLPMNNHEFVKETQMLILGQDHNIKDFHYVSPDSGANRKMFELMQQLDPNNICSKIKCDKTRDVRTGNIINFEVYADDLEGKPCIIVDDICDGGGTFLGLAEELKKKNAGDLYLIVSHGIFSRGFRELKKHFKGIYTTNSWVNNYAIEIPEIEKGSDIVNIIPFHDFISQ